MYKTKIGTWALLLIIAFLVYACPKLITVIFPDEVKSTITVTTSDDNINNVQKYDESYIDMNKKRYMFKKSMNDSEVVIKDASNDTMTGYTKIEKGAYTPVVMYIHNNIDNYNDGFNVGSSADDKYYSKDIKRFFDAMLKDKTFKDMGISSRVAKGKVKIYIPSKNDPNYQEIEDFIYLTMNNGKIPTEEEKYSLKTNVETILSKCNKVEDMKTFLQENNHDVALYTENLACNNYQYAIVSSFNIDANIIVTPKNTVAKYYDIYIKNTPSKVDKATLTKMVNSNIIPNLFGLRVRNSNAFVSRVLPFTADNIRVLN